jgi:hypothetical protein
MKDLHCADKEAICAGERGSREGTFNNIHE